MDRYDLSAMVDASESKQRLINMAFLLLFSCCKRAIEEKDERITIGMIKGAIENVELDLGDLK